MPFLSRYFWVSMILVAPLCGQTVGSATSLAASQSAITQGSVVTLTATVTVDGAPATGGTRELPGRHAIARNCSGDRERSGHGDRRAKNQILCNWRPQPDSELFGCPNGAQHSGASNSATVASHTQQNGLAAAVTAFSPTQEPTGLWNLTASVATLAVPAPSGTVSFINQTSGMSVGSAPLTSGVFTTFPQIFQSSYATSASPASIIVGDFNQDGVLDFAVANGEIGIFLGDPNNPGQFLSPVSYVVGLGTFPPSPLAMVTADFNGDGALDLATANSDGSVSILLGSPSSPGQFLPPTVYASGTTSLGPIPSFTIVAADFNLDGVPDLVIIGSATAVLLNNADSPGLFIAQPTTDLTGDTAAVGDFNGDGYPDLVVSTDDGGATVLFGDPTHPGQFIPASGCSLFCDSFVSGLVVGDFNQDGIPDVAASASWDSNSQVGLTVSLGDPVNRGNFLPQTDYPLYTVNYPHDDYSAAGPVIGDFNGDGVPDLAHVLVFL